jgi:hypothetical protein
MRSGVEENALNTRSGGLGEQLFNVTLTGLQNQKPSMKFFKHINAIC